MKLSFDTTHDFRPAMEAVRTMGLGNEQGKDTPACRLFLEPRAKHVEVLVLSRHHALRLNVPLGDNDTKPGETVLSAAAVRALCAAPLRARLSIETEGTTIVTTIGKRSQVFEAPDSYHHERACKRIVDGDVYHTSTELAAGPSAERLRGIEGNPSTFRISIAADGVRAWSGNDEHVEHEADAVLSETPAEGPPAVFGIDARRIDKALRALRTDTLTLRVAQSRGSTIALDRGSNRIVLAPAALQ